MKKKLMLLAATIVMVLPLFLGLLTSVTAEATDGEGDLTFILHKKRYPEGTNLALIPNTGDVMTDFDNAPGFGEVEFKVYNVTEAFYQMLAGTFPEETTKVYTYDEAMAKVKDETTGLFINTNLADSGITANADAGTVKVGDLTLDGLDSKTDGKNSVYVIVESPKAGVDIADNMVVVLPILNTDNTNKSTIHLYPKNIVSTAGLEVEKVSNLDPAIKLPGAQFVIHRETDVTDSGPYGATGTEYFTGLNAQGVPSWTTVAGDAKKYTTGPDGRFTESGLIYGTYYLTEVTPPLVAIPGTNPTEYNQYVIHDGAINQIFTLSKDNKSQKFTNDPGAAGAITNDDLELEKTADGISYNVGDLIKYTVTSKIPAGINDLLADGNPRYTQYIITDEHSEHLEFQDATLKLTDNDTTFFTLNADYKITTDETGKFVVEFTADGIAKMTPNATLTITYEMKLLKADPDLALNNKATINTNYDDTTGDDDVYTGGYKFKKVDASNGNNPLAGAEFVVRNGDNKDTAKYLKVDTDGTVTWVDTETAATKFYSSDEDASKGIVSITGLEYGTYYLQETKPPTDKYVEIENLIEFEVAQDSFGLEPTPVINKQKGTLPSTGGTGIYVMIAVGLVVMAGAGVWYVRSQRKEA